MAELGEHGPTVGAASLFAQCHGDQPEGIWYAPGRVNLIGEHTDYNDGFALPFAIGAGVCVAAGRRTDELIVVASRQCGSATVTTPLAGLRPGEVGGWAAYPAGVAWALSSAGHRLGGVSLAVDADLPLGSGLSSSAALACATGLALADLHGLALSRADVAAAGRLAENAFVGAPTGVMDQLAVLLSQAGHALLLDCRDKAGTLVPFAPASAGLCLLVIDTRARHELTDGGYGARRRACEQAARVLGVRSLRDVAGTSDLDRIADPELKRRARHAITESQRVLETAGLLSRGDLPAAGPLLTASHVSLRDDFQVSWPEADSAVAAACAAGALGARMTGGGFGGSVIALAPAAAAEEVADTVSADFARRGWRSPHIWPATPSDGARRLR
jgi:galactokinase